MPLRFLNRLSRWLMAGILALGAVLSVLFLQSGTVAQPSPPSSHESAIATLPPRLAQGATPVTLASAGLTLEEVGPGIYSLFSSTDFPASGPNVAICNGSIIIGDNGVLVIDPFQTEDLANLIFDTVADLTDQPIRYVLNSHYHFDHSGGNAAAELRDYPIIGRGPIREFMLSRDQETDPNVTPPDVIVENSGTLWLGDRAVELVEFDGHSGGTDLIAYIPDADVVIAGDLLFTQRVPYLGDANIRVWQATLDQLAQAYPDATIVPGHGPLSAVGDLMALQDYLQDLKALALDWKATGLDRETAIAETPIPEAYRDYKFQGLWPVSLEVAYRQITLGQDDAASIQQFFAQQDPLLQAL
ncbi:MAG: MBL fold metallo-hydrolase [Prochlorothrix sp.]